LPLAKYQPMRFFYRKVHLSKSSYPVYFGGGLSILALPSNHPFYLFKIRGISQPLLLIKVS